MKLCPQCHKTKPLDAFYRRKRESAKLGLDVYRSACKQCDAKAYRDSYAGTKKHREYHKNWKLSHKFGISLDQYKSLVESQNNKCAVCNKTPDDDSMKHSLAVDHDHTTGLVRGLLCRHCNIGIGKLGDSIEGLERALVYLRKHQKLVLENK